MPEWPELVVLREALERAVVGRRIASARAARPEVLKTVEPSIGNLKGKAFESIDRRGKHLILSMAHDLHLIIHLMRSGRLLLCNGQTRLTKATSFVVQFEDGEDLRLIENGSTKRVKVHLVRRPEAVPWIAEAGPDPGSDAFTCGALRDALRGRRQQMKKVLTDQRTIAGIGTAYADEILFEARVSPIRYASTLVPAEIDRLHASIRSVLDCAVEEIRGRSGGCVLAAHDRDFLKVYKRTGHPCPVCGSRIAEIRYAQTRTYYCPTCQSGGRHVPDRRAWLTR